MERPHIRFRKQVKIGSGSFGEVWRGLDSHTNNTVAIKIINVEESESTVEQLQAEVSQLAQCDSRYITRLFCSYAHEGHLYIIMEYVDGGSVLDLLFADVLDEASIAIIVRETLKGLQYLHRQGKIHRDIKAGNVLLCRTGEIKLADLGVAAQLSNTLGASHRNTFVGTPYWMAPEVIRQSNYGTKADIWSLGITVWEMATGDPPLAELHPMKALLAISRKPPPKLDAGFSQDLRSFVAVCLQESKLRPNVDELLTHPLVAKAGNIEQLIPVIRDRQKMLLSALATTVNADLNSSVSEIGSTVSVNQNSSDDSDEDEAQKAPSRAATESYVTIRARERKARALKLKSQQQTQSNQTYGNTFTDESKHRGTGRPGNQLIQLTPSRQQGGGESRALSSEEMEMALNQALLELASKRPELQVLSLMAPLSSALLDMNSSQPGSLELFVNSCTANIEKKKR